MSYWITLEIFFEVQNSGGQIGESMVMVGSLSLELQMMFFTCMRYLHVITVKDLFHFTPSFLFMYVLNF